MFYSVICESNLLQYKHLGVYPINNIDRWGLSASDNTITFVDPTGMESKDIVSAYFNSLFSELGESIKNIFYNPKETYDATLGIVIDKVNAVTEHPILGPVLGISTGVAEGKMAVSQAKSGTANLAAGNKILGVAQIIIATGLGYDALLRSVGNSAEMIDNLSGDLGEIPVKSAPDLIGVATGSEEVMDNADALIQLGISSAGLTTGEAVIDIIADIITVTDSVDTLD